MGTINWLSFLFLPLAMSHALTGTYFVPKQQVYASFSKWNVIFAVDIDPYAQELAAALSRVQLFKTSCAHYFAQELHDPSLANNSRIRTLLSNYKSLLDTQFLQFDSSVRECRQLATKLFHIITYKKSNMHLRPKRALIPLVGDALSYLFGTASQSDISALRAGLGKLRNSQESVVNVLDHSLTMINKSNAEIAKNRRAINALLTVNVKLHSNYRIINSIIHSEIRPSLKYLQIASKLHFLHQIVNHALTAVSKRLSELSEQIDQCLHGHLSASLVSPDLLRDILGNIEKHKPPMTRLPLKFTNSMGLTWYYSNLRVSLLPSHSQVLLKVAIPLVQDSFFFQMYHAVAVPTPHPSAELAVTYALEAPLIGISKDNSHYIMADENELAHCSNNDVAVCNLLNPALAIENKPSCLLALFQSRQEKVLKYCKRIISNPKSLPTAKHLFDGQWLIATNVSFILDFLCSSKDINPGSIKVSAPVSIIKIPFGCVGNSQFFIFPLHFSKTSNSHIQNFFSEHLTLSRTLPNIWNTTDFTLNAPLTFDNIKVPSQLANVESMQISHLRNYY